MYDPAPPRAWRMTQVSAEQFYLFTHAVYREVAYQLQLPSERAQLHGNAMDILEQAFANDLPQAALELAGHARLAEGSRDATELARRETGFLQLALTRGNDREHQVSALRCADRLLELGMLQGDSLAQVLKVRVHLLRDMGRREDTRGALHAALQHAQTHNQTDGIVAWSVDLATFEGMSGNPAAANEWCERAERLAKQSGSPAHAALAMQARASLIDHLGDQPRAEAMLREVIKLLEQSGNIDSANQNLGNLANLLGATGRRTEAMQIYRQLLIYFEAHDSARGQATVLSNLGKQLLILGDYAQAEALTLRAIEIHRRTGVRRSEAFALANISEVWRQLGRLDDSENAVLRALELAREVGQPVYSAAYMATHAGLLLLTGREAEAQDRLEESRAEFEAGGGARYIPEYCDIWRLRVAASQSCTGEAPTRRTSSLRAEPPAPRWVKAARMILTGMESALKLHSTGELATSVAAGRGVVQELEAAIAQRRPAVLLRGHQPSELTAPLRKVLLARLKQRHPSEYALLEKQNPALIAALS